MNDSCEICGGERVIPRNVGIFELEYSPCPICGTKEDVEKFLEEIEKMANNEDADKAKA